MCGSVWDQDAVHSTPSTADEVASSGDLMGHLGVDHALYFKGWQGHNLYPSTCHLGFKLVLP